MIKAGKLTELMAGLPTKDIYGTPSQEVKDNSLKLVIQLTEEFKSLAEQHVGATIIQLDASDDIGALWTKGSVEYSAKEVWRLLEESGYHVQLLMDFHDAFTVLISWSGRFGTLQLGMSEIDLPLLNPEAVKLKD